MYDTRTRVLLAVMQQQYPTVRSVALAVGKSLSATHRHLNELHADGLIAWESGRLGTLRPLVRVVATDGR